MLRPLLHLGSRGLDVADWQGLIGTTVTANFDHDTEYHTKAWQSSHNLVPDGKVGPLSWAAAEGEGSLIVMVSIAHVNGIDHLTTAELKALVAAANWIGINPDWLAAAMSFETSGTFSPSIRNKAGSGATGLIQFMPSTAKLLGTSTDALAAMSFTQQLEYVKRYFAPNRGKLHSLEDVYLAIFYPKEIGRSASDVIGTSPSSIYEQNRGFDVEDKGYITRGDVTRAIVATLNRAINSPRITVPVMGSMGAIALGAASYGLYKLYALRKDAAA